MSFLKTNSRSQTPTLKDGDQYVRVINGLKQIYNSKIKPLETTYNFEGMALCWPFSQPNSLLGRTPLQTLFIDTRLFNQAFTLLH